MPGQFYFARHLDLLHPQYLRHKSRWIALESKGWKFSTPSERENHVGITICRGDDRHTIYVVSSSAEKVHNELLRQCEEYTGMINDPHRFLRLLVLLALSALFAILFVLNLMR